MPELNGQLDGMSTPRSPVRTRSSSPARGTPSINGHRSNSASSNISGHSKNSYGSNLSNRPEVEVIFNTPLEKKYECPICCQVLRYPVQFEECGHRCCSSCLPELLRVAPRCPIDQMHVDREKIYVDKAFQKEVDNLLVKCSYHARGCSWTGNLMDLMVHIEDCEYVIISCPNACGVDFEKRFLDKHLNDDCTRRKVPCDYCGTCIYVDEEVDHLNECPKFPVTCPNGCKKTELIREELEVHMDTECPKQPVDCPFAAFGCEQKFHRKEIQDHLQSEPINHMHMVCDAMVDHKALIEKHEGDIQKHGEVIRRVDKKVDNLEKIYGVQFLWKIDNYEERLADAKSGKKTTLFSPPFYTHRHGYRLTMSACLNGDGKARNKYMSLFLCICKGDYDPLLVWPFSNRINFNLIDQCEDPAARRNITFSIKPNTVKENRPFLGRPVSERNASFGAQKFVELDTVNTLDYIRDDTIYLKVSIDLEDITPL
ncbi:TNF receptor-associated factor 4-like [Lineus longissimus]|uniref:TNF receptor-associated factor 4-like n=1 Tax=Lineus longissimus TaxID=88925 RepID=UPI00315D8508